ncbi:hypothetical protein AB1K81_10495 [Ornithinibacillus sp. 179-J 7C1 HS]
MSLLLVLNWFTSGGLAGGCWGWGDVTRVWADVDSRWANVPRVRADVDSDWGDVTSVRADVTRVGAM